ncbi:DUF624 domain-containing protein [Clostridium butyricum]|uniref:DUF624 domain-containing protein n=1 Tax=Clostridium butyricum TaxID=1492 RepID=A0A2S7F589_CLOBU|nr:MULTISPECIES: DUF624 domain-containing protein [Clostridium]ETI90324.1 MAG: hypothetical protein Q607_CBUC00057G0016 [Clostridium butyricum DORA_1]KHD14629.1 membrane protein [Clostridium butyricum]MDU1005929.1 DUF624 domain-containing protein [Clostridium butyricum]MDU1509681.1 DUF624 domain-containing protein [Clostridium butyricum]MDU4802043.1 DUF624 domain-containing protein [Clostridium butyricum]
MKREFYDKTIYTLTNYFVSFLQASLYFAISNIFLIAYFIFTLINPNIFNLFVLFLVLLPFGPSLGGLYSMCGKSLREKDMFFASHYFKYYKMNFLSNLKIWFFITSICFVLLIDLQYFYLNKTSSGVYIFFKVLVIFLSLISLYAFPINSRFYIKLKDLLLTSIYYMIKKFPVTIMKGALIFLLFYIIKSISVIFLIFIPVPLCFIFMHYDNIILNELEKQSVSNIPQI